ENARLFDAPDTAPRIICAAAGTGSAELAARIADGLWVTSPSGETVDAFRSAGGKGDVLGQLTICFDRDRDRAVETAYRIWPNAAIPGQLSQDLPTWTHFEQAAKLVTAQKVGRRSSAATTRRRSSPPLRSTPMPAARRST